MNDQRTVYCGERHRRADGVPIGHSCRVLAPEFLEAERREEYGLAAAFLERMAIVLHAGVADAEHPEPYGAATAGDRGAASPRVRRAVKRTHERWEEE